MKAGIDKQKSRAADLCAGHVVVRRSQPHFGDAPSSRLVAGANLWPRHLLLFYEMPSIVNAANNEAMNLMKPRIEGMRASVVPARRQAGLGSPFEQTRWQVGSGWNVGGMRFCPGGGGREGSNAPSLARLRAPKNGVRPPWPALARLSPHQFFPSGAWIQYGAGNEDTAPPAPSHAAHGRGMFIWRLLPGPSARAVT